MIAKNIVQNKYNSKGLVRGVKATGEASPRVIEIISVAKKI